MLDVANRQRNLHKGYAMFKFFNRLPVARQISILGAIVCFCVFSALTVFVAVSSERSALRQTEAKLQTDLKLVTDTLEYVYQDHMARAARNIATFKSVLNGQVTASGATMVMAGNELPVLKIGDEVINDNKRIVAEFARLTGVDGAILVRKGVDFYRATTMLKDKDGKSTVGTPLPSNEASVVSLRKGETYAGFLFRNDRAYMSRMEPIFNANREVIGAITVRIDFTADIEKLKKWMGSIPVGKTGYLFGFTPLPGKDIAQYVLHPSNAGKKVGDSPDEATRNRVASVIAAKGGTQIYDWPDKTTGEVKKKIAVYGVVPNWNWVIGTGSFIEEFVTESVALRNALIVVSVVAGLVTLSLIYLLVAMRLKPLAPALRAIERIGEGDLTASIANVDSGSRNEIDRLASSVNLTGAQIGSLIRGITGSMQQLSSAAIQMQESSQQASQTAHAQSDATAGMASAVEQLTVSIGHIADSAREADAITQRSRDASGDGALVVSEAVSEMQQIAEALQSSSRQISDLGASSQQIVGIVGVIREVADKTNLLALNAAIEAARAGEQGRGFAVVADEVRKLAERTSQSTQDIESMIGKVRHDTQAAVVAMEGIAARMSAGMDKARAAGDALTQISAHADKTVVAVQEIAHATSEQRQASSDIARSVEHIARMTEANSAITAQNSAAAVSMLALSHELKTVVGRFRLSSA